MNTDGTLVDTICRKTGVSIRNLAIFIGADQSLLSKFTNHTRGLPTPAMLELALLYKKLMELAPVPATIEKAGDRTVLTLQSDAEWLLAKCYPLKKKLDDMQEKELQAKQMLALVAALETDPGQATELKKGWVASQRYDAEKKLSKNNWLLQQKIIIKIKLLRYEAGLLQELAKPAAETPVPLD